MKKDVIIIDDHKIFGEGFCSLLEKINIRVKRIFQSPKKALYYLKRNVIGIVFCDINMPEIDGIELIKKIKKLQNGTKVIMVSMYNEKNIINAAIKNGADCYLNKNCSIEQIEEAIKCSYSNIDSCFKKQPLSITKSLDDTISLKYRLTKREKEIISQILKEKSNSEIGEILQISKRTVETHRKNIMLKLDVKNSIGIAVKALKHELV
jgi:DNA-binding NarL/FixJ family response regulator